MNVIVTGSLGYDYIMDFSGRFADRIIDDKIHKISLSFLVDTLKRNFGGTAGNFAYTSNLLGLHSILLSTVGNDFQPYKEFLEKQKIETKYIAELPDILTGTYFGVTDQDDNQIGAYYGAPLRNNINLSIKKITIPIDFVHISPHNPKAMVKQIKECQSMNLKYMYDPAFQTGDFSRDELREGIAGAEILIGNDYEIELISEKAGVTHEELRTMVPVLVTTLGSKGSVVETRRDSIHVKPAIPKNTSDPTGAGDAYRAGFVAGYLHFAANHPRGESFRTSGAYLSVDELQVCGQIGSVAAVYTVEKYGTQTHTFTINKFKERYKQNYGTELTI